LQSSSCLLICAAVPVSASPVRLLLVLGLHVATCSPLSTSLYSYTTAPLTLSLLLLLLLLLLLAVTCLGAGPSHHHLMLPVLVLAGVPTTVRAPARCSAT
jgi:hypothetical protein